MTVSYDYDNAPTDPHHGGKMTAGQASEEIERLKQWHMDASLMRDALKIENAALRTRLERVHSMICSALVQQSDEARDILQRAVRMLA